ncbi:MAG: alpha/beta fold hydrolase [Chthoniobacterales bacterium]
MRPVVVALHGFLGCGSDWEPVRCATKSALDWRCPDLFSRGSPSFAVPHVDRPCWLAGYSFGARLALRRLQEEPSRYLGALLVSADPGNFRTAEERAARQASDLAWAGKFRSESWLRVTGEWNAQRVFATDPALERGEDDFDRGKLASALGEFSVAAQFTDPLKLPPRLVWLAGGRDTKFCALLDDMVRAGFPGSFLRVEGAGHRLLHAAPEAVAAALDDLVA